jgi:arylsulfatase A-like enzyme
MRRCAGITASLLQVFILIALLLPSFSLHAQPTQPNKIAVGARHAVPLQINASVDVVLQQAVTPDLPASPQGITHVVVISLDGARPDGIRQAPSPNIEALAARGAVAWQASTVYPSVTLPAHASMLTGLDISEHGLSDNDSIYPCPVITAPTFVTQAGEAGYRTAMVVGKEKLCRFHQSEAVDYTFAREGDRSVVDRALELLNGGYEVLFLQFPNPDYFGHSTSWMSATYLSEMRNTDRQVGRVLAALDELNLMDETLVILTADHGGHDMEHGQNIPEDMTIPWIIAGPGVVAGTELGDDIRVTDTAITVLWALGLPLPENAGGRPVIEAFGAAQD